MARQSRGNCLRPSGPFRFCCPHGISAIDAEGQPFDDPEARRALHDAIRSGMRPSDVIELDLHINDPEFADFAARKLIELMEARQGARKPAPKVRGSGLA